MNVAKFLAKVDRVACSIYNEVGSYEKAEVIMDLASMRDENNKDSTEISELVDKAIAFVKAGEDFENELFPHNYRAFVA